MKEHPCARLIEILLLGALTLQLASAPDLPVPVRDMLSAREIEVLHLIAEGASNQENAAALVISLGTVKSHLNHIMSKLQAHNRMEAVAHARKLGCLAA